MGNFMLLGKKAHIRYLKSIAIASMVSVCGLQTLIAQTEIPEVGPLESQALDAWHAAFSQNPPSTEGCFHASYPGLVWESVECAVGEPQVRPAARSSEGGATEVTGNGHDWALGATGLITAARGQFYKVTDVTSETDVGVASFGGTGHLGPNEYTLQLNSNNNRTTSACAGHSGCTIWQQYVYATDYITKGKAAVFIQYWLSNWGKTACPTGWLKSGTSCLRNSAFTTAPNFKITDLGNMSLEAQAAAGGHDVVTFFNGTEAYALTANDSVLHLGTVWTEAEFNVVGNGGGSRAVFNQGAKLAVLLRVVDGSSKAPHCLYNAGTTGETNNLNIVYPGGCAAGVVGTNPAIEFIEAN
jgi:hypothetical protein